MNNKLINLIDPDQMAKYLFYLKTNANEYYFDQT